MDVGVQLQLVVGDRELRDLAAHAEDSGRLAGQPELDPLLQLGRVHGMAEAQRDHGLLHRRIDRVLIELGAGGGHHERGRPEWELVLGQAHVPSDQPLVEGHRVQRADRPVVRRLKAEGSVRRPAPRAGQRGAHGDPVRHLLADARDGCGGPVEGDDERVGLLVLLDLSSLGRVRAERDDHGPWPRLPPEIAPKPARRESDARDCDAGGQPGPRGQPYSRQTDRPATPADPARGFPGDAAEEDRPQTSDDCPGPPERGAESTHGLASSGWVDGAAFIGTALRPGGFRQDGEGAQAGHRPASYLSPAGELMSACFDSTAAAPATAAAGAAAASLRNSRCTRRLSSWHSLPGSSQRAPSRPIVTILIDVSGTPRSTRNRFTTVARRSARPRLYSIGPWLSV